MNKDFEKLVESVNKSRSSTTSKIIKGKAREAHQIQKMSLLDFGNDLKSQKSNNSEKLKKSISKKEQFIIEPKYENDILKKLQVSCSCGNKTEIKLIPENPDDNSEKKIKNNSD